MYTIIMIIIFGLFSMDIGSSRIAPVHQDSSPHTAPQTIAVIRPNPLSPSSPLKTPVR